MKLKPGPNHLYLDSQPGRSTMRRSEHVRRIRCWRGPACWTGTADSEYVAVQACGDSAVAAAASVLQAPDDAWTFTWPLKPLAADAAGAASRQRMALHFYEGIVLDLDRAKCALFVQEVKGKRTVVASGARLAL